jgi:hypothetical protein
MGLFSFMQEESPTYGSITSTLAFKKQCAVDSLEYNSTDKTFCELFPELLEVHLKLKEQKDKLLLAAQASLLLHNNSGGDVVVSASLAAPSGGAAAYSAGAGGTASWTAIAGVLAAIVACTWAILMLAL